MRPSKLRATAMSATSAALATTAFLDLVQEQGFLSLTLREVAARAGLGMAELYSLAPSKAALVNLTSRTLDLDALRAVPADETEAHDRLFDAVMARLEVMAPRRDALIAIARQAPALTLAQFPFTARALLEAAGLEAKPVRVAAMAAAWAQIARVWRKDEGALNRTMAEADTRLRQMRSALSRISAGY